MGSKLQQGVNDLLTWCQNNGEWGQQLINEWVGLDKERNKVEMNMIARTTSKSVQWKCTECNYIWESTVANRTLGKSGCPKCRGKRLSIRNSTPKHNESLQYWCNKNGSWGQRLIKEFIGRTEKGIEIFMDSLKYASNTKVMWKCMDCGHIYASTVCHRTCNRRGCPACRNLVTTETNNLDVWCDNNGEYGKLLKSEWTGLCSDGKIYSINEVVYGSKKRFLWECKEGHQWETTVSSRTRGKSRCSKCISFGTSYPEQFIYWSLKQLYQDAENRSKQFGFELDIYIPSINFAVEYGSEYWHKYKEEYDNYKKKKCKELGIKILSIVEKVNLAENKYGMDCIEYKYGTDIKDVTEHIINKLGHRIVDIDTKYSEKQAYKYSGKTIIDEHRLDAVYPELYKEFNVKLNRDIGLSVENISTHSHKKAYWTCTKCRYGKDGEWNTKVIYRTSNKTGCPNCGWNWYEQVYKKSGTKESRKLKSMYPELYNEYNHELNNDAGIDIEKLSYASCEVVYWTCTKCGYGSDGEWKSRISRRTAKGYETGCPNCGWSWKERRYKRVKRRNKDSNTIHNSDSFWDALARLGNKE